MRITIVLSIVLPNWFGYPLNKHATYLLSYLTARFARSHHTHLLLHHLAVDYGEAAAVPGPAAVGDDVNRVGGERMVMSVELAHLVSSTVVVRVADRRQRTVDHAAQAQIHLETARNLVDHPVSRLAIPVPDCQPTTRRRFRHMNT